MKIEFKDCRKKVDLLLLVINANEKRIAATTIMNWKSDASSTIKSGKTAINFNLGERYLIKFLKIFK